MVGFVDLSLFQRMELHLPLPDNIGMQASGVLTVLVSVYSAV